MGCGMRWTRGSACSHGIEARLERTAMITANPVLEVSHLRTHFFTDRGVVKAVDDVSFKVMTGEVLGIIGESGSGKSVTALSVMGLVPNPPGRVVGGEIRFQGEYLVQKPPEEMVHHRGNHIAMIFQDPMTSLDPVFTVEEQLVETVRFHRGVETGEALDLAVDMLERVKIPSPAERLKNYPFQLSGGMRQRVMIAIALSCRPDLLIADEPTTALDVTIQAQILVLLRELQREFGMAIIFITHDFGVVSKLADRVAVMYAGKILETADANVIFDRPQHPYTIGLMESRPVLGRRKRLIPIEGSPPDLLNPPPGCPFAPRCKEMIDGCWAAMPSMRQVGDGHYARCIRRGN
jgi:oligopeptide/dipeptide ABC transporter ATP-binding protein